MNIKIEELTRRLTAAWSAVTDAKSASYIAEKIVITALRKDSRMNPIRESLQDLAITRGLHRHDIKTISSKGSSRVYDFGGCPGITHLKKINDEAVKLAKQYGLAALGIRNTGGIHSLSTWVIGIPEHDCIGFFAWNGGSYTTVPYGSREPFFGTNPIAYSIPTLTNPIVLDMSTSEIPFMNLMKAIHNNEPLGPRQGLDDAGRETTDPRKVYDIENDGAVKLSPVGAGHKGSAIMIFLEILTGSFVGAKMSREATDDPFTPSEFGGLFMCFDLKAFCEPQTFKENVSRMTSQIRASNPAFGFHEVQIPGDHEFEREQENKRRGTILLDDDLIVQLNSLI